MGKLPQERWHVIPARARAVACTRRAWRAREATPRAEIAHSARDAARARGDMRAAVRRARRARARGGARGTHRARVMSPWLWGACYIGRACARGRLLEGGGGGNLAAGSRLPLADAIFSKRTPPHRIFYRFSLPRSLPRNLYGRRPTSRGKRAPAAPGLGSHRHISGAGNAQSRESEHSSILFLPVLLFLPACSVLSL